MGIKYKIVYLSSVFGRVLWMTQLLFIESRAKFPISKILTDLLWTRSLSVIEGLVYCKIFNKS